MSVERRRQMIEPHHPRLSVARQCELVSISRSGFYHKPAGETPLNLTLMRLIDEQFLETPWDNVFIERLWRSLKYECVYLHAFETGSELRAGLTWWINYYNARRPHSMLAGRTPDDAYWAPAVEKLAA